MAARSILIIAMVIMCLLSTTGLISGVAFYVVELGEFGFNPSDTLSIFYGLDISLNLFLRLNYLISDSIVVWRAWILWPNNMQTFGNSKFTPNGARTLIMTLPLFLTNFTVTLLMACKVWRYRSEIKRDLGMGKRKTQVEKVLVLLTESGAIYCMLWIIDLVTTATHSLNSLAYEVAVGLFPELTVIYPTIIILLVALDRTSLGSTVIPTLSESIQFSSRPPNDVSRHSTNIYVTSIQQNTGTHDSEETPPHAERSHQEKQQSAQFI
ncbi:hypothetical protein C8J56DRAFT_1042564 [Mycena floridula]|nr:hypothetical protein C8J56DRAFT_1042564 [Mycena floridula]